MTNYLAADMKEQAQFVSIDPRKEEEKDSLMQATKGVVVSLSHDAKQALLKDVMKQSLGFHWILKTPSYAMVFGNSKKPEQN